MERIDDMMQGHIPWTVREFRETMEWYGTLRDTPKDDWNLSWRWGVNLLDEDSGEVRRLRMNPFISMNQLMMHLKERYSPEEASHHGYRFFQITEFAEKNRERLRDDGLFRYAEDGTWEAKEELLQALCTLPYSQQIEDNSPARTFEYGEVVAAARRIEQDVDRGEGDAN